MPVNIVISGPATVGKTRLLKYIDRKYKDLERGISHTTRPRRMDEVDGKDYYFVSEDEFMMLAEQCYFAYYKKNSMGYWYGISHDEIGMTKSAGNIGRILDFDPDGFEYFKEMYNNVVGVYLLPDSLYDIERRLRGRYSLKKNEVCDEFEKKFKQSIESLKHVKEYDFVVFNNNIISLAHKIHLIYVLYSSSLSRKEVEKWIEYYVKRLI